MKRLNGFFVGHERTVVIKRNVFGLFVSNGLGFIVTIMMVPLTLSVLQQEKYGVWITLFSIANWLNVMDVGLGHGFRNKFAEAIALGQKETARAFLETIYGSTFLIALGILAIFFLINPLIDYNKLLNVSSEIDENLTTVAILAVSLVAVQLILKNINSTLLALQKTALSSFVIVSGNILAFSLILIFKKLNVANLHTITIAYLAAPSLAFLAVTVYMFMGGLKQFRPKTFLVRKVHFNRIMRLGIKFFVLQLTAIVIISSGNLIIAQLYGVKNLTPYFIAYKLFSTATTVFFIVLSPFWSAYTEAITKKDFGWVKESLSKLKLLWVFFSGTIIVLLLFSGKIYALWVGPDIFVPNHYSLHFAIYAVLLAWCAIFTQFVNGAGKIKIQFFLAIFQCLVFVPLALVLAKGLKLGPAGIIIATNIILVFSAIVLPLQSKMIYTQTDNGWWSK